MSVEPDATDAPPPSWVGRPRRRTPQPVESVDFLSVITLVLWLAALAIGIAGLLLPGSLPEPPAAGRAPPPTEMMNVELDNQPPPQLTDTAPPVAAPPDEPAPAPTAPPAMPTLVAAPGPAVAFGVPVTGPTQHTDAAHAGLTHAVAAPLPVIRQLTYGRGEGEQPAPQYPASAVADQQQGTVVVQFVVDADGAVTMAQASSPCPWPLLNDAAVRAVRDTWRFKPGPIRHYQVAIRFQLRQL